MTFQSLNISYNNAVYIRFAIKLS